MITEQAIKSATENTQLQFELEQKNENIRKLSESVEILSSQLSELKSNYFILQ